MSAPIALAQVALVALGTWVAVRERQAFQRSIGILLLVASAVSLWSATRLSGALLHYAVFWIAAIGVLNSAFALDLLVDALGIRIGARSRRAVMTACVTLAVVALVPAWRETRNLLAKPEERLKARLLIQGLADPLTDYVRANPALGRPLIRMGVESWWIGAGVLDGCDRRWKPARRNSRQRRAEGDRRSRRHVGFRRSDAAGIRAAPAMTAWPIGG